MFITESWFWRGTQSAVFYYISCAPCSKVLYRRKQQKEAQRAKAEKAALKASEAQGNIEAVDIRYDHPLPSSTNPHWKEEMALGPGPPPKRRNQHEKEKGKSKAGSMELQGGSGTGGTNNSKVTSSDSQDGGGTRAAIVLPQDATHHEPEEGWNRRRYQREDELLWGTEPDHDPTLPGAPLSRTTSGGRGQGSYYYARNPAVNDLHPPVVSTAPQSRLETQWMLQPPPRAKIMEGKEKENRSRSGTGSTRSSRASSKRAAADHGGLERQMVEGRLRRTGGDQLQASVLLGVDGGLEMSRSRSGGSSNQSMASIKMAMQQGQRHEREMAARSCPSTDSLEPPQRLKERTAGLPPVSLDLEPDLPSPPPARPGLSTIPSTSLVSTSRNESQNLSNTSKLSSPPSTNGTTSSNKIHQELAPPSSQISRSASLNDPPVTRPKFPTPDNAQEDVALPLPEFASPFPETADGWIWSGAGRSVHGNGGGGHRHRWSMDI